MIIPIIRGGISCYKKKELPYMIYLTLNEMNVLMRVNNSIAISFPSQNDDTIVRGGGSGSESYDRNYHRGK